MCAEVNDFLPRSSFLRISIVSGFNVETVTGAGGGGGGRIVPETAEFANLNFRPLEVVGRGNETQHQSRRFR